MARAARSKSHRHSSTSDLPTTYVVEIADWEWGFSFGVNMMRHRDDPYSDYRHLALRGKLLHPSKLKAEKVELNLLPDPRLNWGQREKDEPQAVGSLALYQGRLSGILSMPGEHCLRCCRC